jgi:hypothetical protein
MTCASGREPDSHHVDLKPVNLTGDIPAHVHSATGTQL